MLRLATEQHGYLLAGHGQQWSAQKQPNRTGNGYRSNVAQGMRTVADWPSRPEEGALPVLWRRVN